ncbi:hypothetical protein [Devosia sp.]|uniref:hypothetical protein n=1 Tax=Devosia sp. TaxID=1871048 RepID=UPI002930C25B|nr:hypothetical protein [Devosia sp.]
MHFELAAEGILAWLGRLIIDRTTTPHEQPRGPLIAMLALGCWLVIALAIWGIVGMLRG